MNHAFDFGRLVVSVSVVLLELFIKRTSFVNFVRELHIALTCRQTHVVEFVSGSSDPSNRISEISLIQHFMIFNRVAHFLSP